MKPLAAPSPVADGVAPPAEQLFGARPAVAGKFLSAGSGQLYVRGVTYGAFKPDADGREHQDSAVIHRDFALMTAAGINAVRIPHTTPSRLLFDAAAQHGLRVLVNLEAEQQVGHISDGKRVASIARRLQRHVAECAGHPALLGYTLGNEIPAATVRWLGCRRVERYLESLYFAAKDTDPDGLVSYANYPSTEYLELPFLDLVCFNIYLESPEQLKAYLARLQNLAGDRPLLVTEIGLDAHRHGERAQARAIDWMVRTSFGAGCAGTFVFAWTDDWHRAGEAVSDWAFGMTDRARRPKPALAALERAYREVPFSPGTPWPAASIVVCSHNGAGRIRECLEGIASLDYPNPDVIVVDDGSHDDTSAVAREFPVRVIRTDHRGLSHARNAGLEAARGAIVAYLDDDSYPDPGWLKYLVATLITSSHVGVGGPNIAPPGDGLVAGCVADAPGGPTHVLLTDTEAEHIPGCNMAFTADALRAIGGFDEQFRIAGDDVDVCWRLQQRGWTLGFSPSAVVWHHCRDSVRGYWRQQRQYGRAEAFLERKWPDKYTPSGHVRWAGRLYGGGLLSLARSTRVYHGVWGSAPFQFRFAEPIHPLQVLPAIPEWYLVLGIMAALAFLGIAWTPLRVAIPVLAAGVVFSAVHAFAAARPAGGLVRRGLTMWLHLIQPAARLLGRTSAGLTPWRRGESCGFAIPRPRTMTVWSERPEAPDSFVQSLERALRAHAGSVARGGDYDRWDLEARSGLFGTVRILTAVEDHGGGRQLIRLRLWPRPSRAVGASTLAAALLAAVAAANGAWTAAGSLGTLAALIAGRIVYDTGTVTAGVLRAAKAALRERG